MDPLFVNRQGASYRLLIATLLALALITSDVRFGYFEYLRSAATLLTAPLYWVAGTGDRLMGWYSEVMESREGLRRKNRQLIQELRRMQGERLQYGAVLEENRALRKLFDSTRDLSLGMGIAELVGTSAVSGSRRIIINKGSRDGVFVNQVALDSFGLLGQVVRVGPYTGEILLITDPTHRVPSRFKRNGVLAVVQGTGFDGALLIPDASRTRDFAVGDALVTSGLGGVFPRGYPVGEVKLVQLLADQRFARVEITPRARFDNIEFVLLVKAQAAEAEGDAEASMETVGAGSAADEGAGN